jgi:hypothetical protein
MERKKFVINGCLHNKIITKELNFFVVIPRFQDQGTTHVSSFICVKFSQFHFLETAIADQLPGASSTPNPGQQMVSFVLKAQHLKPVSTCCGG